MHVDSAHTAGEDLWPGRENGHTRSRRDVPTSARAAERGVIEIVVSAIALVEVLARNRTSGIDDQRVRDFFDNDYILLVNVDKTLHDD
jgi:hypothetical protein